jgi:hypothetical protein
MSDTFRAKQWDISRANFDRNLAVVIGIDRYKNDSIRNLSTAVSDARAISFLGSLRRYVVLGGGG